MAETEVKGKVRAIAMQELSGGVSSTGEYVPATCFYLSIAPTGSDSEEAVMVLVTDDLDDDSLPFLTRLQLLRDALAKDLWVAIRYEDRLLKSVAISRVSPYVLEAKPTTTIPDRPSLNVDGGVTSAPSGLDPGVRRRSTRSNRR